MSRKRRKSQVLQKKGIVFSETWKNMNVAGMRI